MNTTTAGQVIDDVLDQLEEDHAAPIFWNRAELLQFVNDAYLEFLLISGHLVKEYKYDLISAKVQSIPSGAIAAIHIAYNNKKIEKVTVEHFDRENPNWVNETGVLKKWAPMGLQHWINDRHTVLPRSVTIATLDRPPVFAEETVIDLAQEYIDALTEYVFHMARFKESGLEFQQAMPNYDKFVNKAGIRQQRTFAEQWLLWSRDPDADTGENYSTEGRGN